MGSNPTRGSFFSKNNCLGRVVLLCLSVVLRCFLSEHFIDDLSYK